jgi:Tfp pilus assembly protein PilX
MNTKYKQQGIVLVVALILLVVLTLLGISAMDTTILENRLSKNNEERHYAFQAGEAGLRQAQGVYNSNTLVNTLRNSATRTLDVDTAIGRVVMSRKITGTTQTSQTRPGSTIVEFKGEGFGIPRGVPWGAGATSASYFETRTTGVNLENGAVRTTLHGGMRQLAPSAN